MTVDLPPKSSRLVAFFMACRPLIAFAAACAWLALLAAGSLADEPAPAITPEQEKLFEEKVRPVLAANCLECHGAKKQESGLRLDSRTGVIDGGDSGERAVVPGDPGRSLLIKAVNHLGEYHMPPKRKLADDEIAALTEWVEAGVPWPATKTPVTEHKQSPHDLAKQHRQSHWAYQPVTQPIPSAIQNPKSKIQNPIDAFVIARLAAEGLSPSPPADPRTLIRRLSFDLLGLPPMPDEVDGFTGDQAPDAYERLVDRLLASPRFGERWGAALARCGPLWRHQGLCIPARATLSLCVHVSRLCDSGVQRRFAIRRVYPANSLPPISCQTPNMTKRGWPPWAS